MVKLQMQKPALVDNQWCIRYAQKAACLSLKRNPTSKEVKAASITIKKTFSTIYRAVAFDIDGTLTKPGSADIDPVMAKIIGHLLRRSVPVLLITGRGRGSTRGAANQIINYAKLSSWYAIRMQCITHNGCYVIRTVEGGEHNLLAHSEPLTEGLDDIPSLCRALDRDLRAAFPNVNISITEEPKSVRISVVMSGPSIHKVKQVVTECLESTTSGNNSIFISHGSYVNRNCLDIATTNKLKALDNYASSIGITPDKIIRIGDQGQEGGNDFDLLNSAQGFSVGEISDSPDVCFPVLNDKLNKRLFGAQATEELLRLVMLFPSLSIAPTPPNMRLAKLRSFEHLALVRSRQETETVTQRLRVRLRYLLPETEEISGLHTLQLDDIYDRMSGAIRIRDWEMDGFPQGHAAFFLFGLDNANIRYTEPPKLQWAMYSDTSILMRGPNYYYGMTHGPDATLSEYISVSMGFIRDATSVLDKLAHERPSFVGFKLVLAVLDNIRNMILTVLNAVFVAESANKGSVYNLTNQIYTEAVVRHTHCHYGILLNPDTDWYEMIIVYKVLLESLTKTFTTLKTYDRRRSLKNLSSDKPLIRTWRECDHFLQNVTAVQLGLHELRQREDIRDHSSLVAVGLPYGGIELPAIAQIVAEVRGFHLDAGLLKVSIYGDRAIGQLIRHGEHDYVAEQLLKQRPFTIMGSNDKTSSLAGRSILLLDDNCTTCVTLQLARDSLVLLGADVLGAIVVRFPGFNRHVQMSMKGHGFPDPEIFFSFIRGLVSPSPYTRLLAQHTKKGPKVYLDKTGSFDKAKDRIKRYLFKNGTPEMKG